jgi:glucose/arabinose dehydrogenase
MRYRVDELVSGLGVVWGMAFLSPNALLLTERDGRVYRLELTKSRKIEIGGAPEVWNEGQGGLLDVAVPPGYSQTDWIYFTYSKAIGDRGSTVLARARLKGDTLNDWQELLVTDSTSDSGRHFGSRIAFDTDGHVFFTVGDRGNRPNGQDLGNHSGTIIRLNLDGTVPEDNPFTRAGTRPEIWSFGHRNPQGIFYDAFTATLWANEHGPRGGDEINRIEAGQNYGWPVVSHGKEYWGPQAVGEATSKAGMKNPVKVYIPSIAPGSLLVYQGDAFPAWRGNLFSGALKLEHLNRVVLDDNLEEITEERLLSSLGERIRAVVESPEGWIYVSTDAGRILVIRPN